MVKTRKTMAEKMDIAIDVFQRDINDGVPCTASLCMEKVAIARALDKIDPGAAARGQHHKVRVDAGHIKFNYQGYRWKAETPKAARRALIMFDNKKTRPEVKPHSYKLTAIKGTKIKKGQPLSAERKKQILQAQRDRQKAGRNRYMLRQRLVGFDLGHG